MLITVFLVTAILAAAHPDSWQDDFKPAPEPFSLNSYDVIQAVQMLRRERFLQYWDYVSAPVTIIVREVYSVHVGFDPDALEEHRNRYDVILNGIPVDWDHTYIHYGSDMINLRLLFTYRNQQPVPGVPYRLTYHGE